MRTYLTQREEAGATYLEEETPYLTKEWALKVFETMHLTRALDEKYFKLVRQNKGGTFQLSVAGHELVGALSAHLLQPGVDWGLPYYRDRAFAVGLGASVEDLLAAFLARDTLHHCGGRMMPDHFSQLNLRIPPQSSCVGSQFLQAVGLAKSAQLRKVKEVVYVSGGEGATSQGDFHEMLNFACLHTLPLVVVIQDNGWAISVPIKEQTAGGTIAKMARGYEGLAVFEVDGCDYRETAEALFSAFSRAREGGGPALVVAKVPRLGSHSNSDDPKKYRDGEKLQDPLHCFAAWLLEKGVPADELEQVRQKAREQVERAAAAAEQVPFPPRSTATDHLFKEVEPSQSTTVASGEAIVMMDALNHALLEEMERDAGVVVFGEDVAHGKGGVFGITRTLTERFGLGRCFNTPLAESTIIALAHGLSLDGFHKPVAEIQFADYSWPGMNQLLNEIASVHYRSKGQWNCPLVIRMPYGGYIQGGAYHSQSIEAIFCHIPGIKVVIPSHAADAKCLLKMAIRDPNPVIFLEHKALYRQRLFCARPEPGPDELLALGKARILKKGSDITYVGWGMTALMGFEVAEGLEKEGISVEVIDLSTLIPLDFVTILASVKKNGKLLIAHEAPRTCGFGAELAARAAEEAFLHLDAPVVRVGGKDCPIPYCKDLEEEILPQKKEIEAALRTLAQF